MPRVDSVGIRTGGGIAIVDGTKRVTSFMGKHLPIGCCLYDDVGSRDTLSAAGGVCLRGSAVVAQLSKPSQTDFGTRIAR